MAVVKRTPVGAHYGLRDWLVQRVTALLMLAAFIILALALLVCHPSDYAAWRDFIYTDWVRVLLLMAVFSLVWHAYIGMRDIFMDYIKFAWLRLGAMIAVAVYLLACSVWAAIILL